MNRSIPGFIIFCIFVYLATGNLPAQSRIPEKYVQKEKVSLNPLTVSIQVGWGQLVVGPEMLPVFQNTQNTVLGGPHIGAQALFPVPWLWDRLTLGLDLWYHRVGKRFLGDVDYNIVHYAGTKEPVTYDETVSGYGAHGVADVVIIPEFHLQVGGGMIYLQPHEANLTREVDGLFPETVAPTMLVAVDVSFARYEGGSIDLYVRAVRQFGEYRNVLVQGTLGFSLRL